MEQVSTDKITVTIDGRTSDVPQGTTILNAARQMGISIPTLCNYRGMVPYGACRVCIVEMETPRGPRQIASLQLSGGKRHDRPHRYTSRSATVGRTILELLLAQAPDSKPLAEFAAALRRHVIARLQKRSRRRVHPVRAVCAGMQRSYGPRRDKHVRPRVEARSAARVRRKERAVPGVRRVRFRVPHGSIRSKKSPPVRTKKHATAFNQFLEARPNIDFAHPQAVPRVPSIDRESCVHLYDRSECGLCSQGLRRGRHRLRAKRDDQGNRRGRGAPHARIFRVRYRRGAWSSGPPSTPT